MSWSSIQEQITDGTSGLAPNSGPIAVVMGTSSKGSTSTLGKKSDVHASHGYGELPNRIKSMQKTMADVSILAVRTEGDIKGSISPIETSGNINITVSGEPLCTVNITAEIYTEGESGLSEIKLNINSDKNEEIIMVIPDDGILSLEDLGLTLIFPLEELFTETNKWRFSTTAPTTKFETFTKSLEHILEIYTPEVIFIAQTTDAEFNKKLGSLSERLFEDHRPVLFLTETMLNPGNFDEAITEKQKEFAKVSSRFVSVVCEPNTKSIEKMSGLVAGHITKAKVNQSIGATNYFPVYDYTLPQGWTNVHSRALDESRFITLRTYAGLQNLFWSNGRTMASDISDYRYIEVVRTVFKAIRLARRASLPYIQAPGDTAGLQNLLAEVNNAVEGMTTSNPRELDDFEIIMPEGQDIVNNGVRLDISLFGIPVIRKILLNFMFKYNKRN
ncbi:MAG: DUF2586 family protein [Brevinema sp.]